VTAFAKCDYFKCVVRVLATDLQSITLDFNAFIRTRTNNEK